MNKKALPLRSEVAQNETWDLSSIFKTEELCRQTQKHLIQATNRFSDQYQDEIRSLNKAEDLLRATSELEQVIMQLHSVSTYVFLHFYTDMRNDKYGKWMQEIQLLQAKIMSDISFFWSELAETDQKIVEEAIEDTPHYKVFLTDKLAEREYLLEAETEKVLAALTPTFNLPSSVYDTIKAQDMQFPDFEANGERYPLSYVLFENNYARDPDSQVRRQAFKAFSNTLTSYHNTNAELLLGDFTHKQIIAELRGFENATEHALYYQKSTRDLYDRQIDLLMNELAPHMRRYAKLLQKDHQLTEMHFADLLVPLDPEYAPDVSIKDAEQYISDSLQIMGPDYHDMLMRSFPERWMDFAQNVGKSTGGFCASLPSTHPYILLNWSNKLSEVFTLAHELGHAAQNILISKENSYFERDMPFYLIEAPSTAHELLLTDSLLKKNQDPRFKRWVLSSMIGNTYYHNAVTHLHEACFQRTVKDKIAAGQQLSASDLDTIFLKVLQDFWGDSVIIDSGAEKTWMRQPHYYSELYSYTYSASLVVSTDFYLNLNQDPEAAIGQWMNFLSTGGPLTVIDQAKLAGVDLTTDQPLRRMIEFVGKIVDELEELSKN